MTEFYFQYYESAAGWIEVKTSERHVHGISFVEEPEENTLRLPAVSGFCIRQLEEYFSGDRQSFEIPLFPSGTPFQNRVWDALKEIPFGTTWSYHQLAKKLGDEKVIRAAAHANAKNPLAIIIPCHRVIGSDGSLVGYAGGLKRKQLLLDHEAKASGRYQKLF